MSLRRLKVRGEYIQFDENSLKVYGDNENPRAAEEPNHRYGFAGRNGPGMIVLNVTHRCNLACAYCFVGDYQEKLPHMSTQTALKALELFAPGQPMSVSFFGGEPLLEWDLIVTVTQTMNLMQRAMPRQRNGQVPYFAKHVTTNGVLLDDAKAQFLARNGFSLIVSVDGPPDSHDTFRPAQGGGGSFVDVMRGLEAVRRYPTLAKRTTLRGTFTAACLRLRERIEFLNQLVWSGYANSVSVEPASLAGYEGCAQAKGEHAFSDTMLPDIKREYEEVADWYLEQFEEGRRPVFFHFDKFLQRLVRSELGSTPCGAGWGYMAIGPNGDIYPCHRESTPIGHVDTGINEEARLPWLDLRWYRNEKCPTCWARNLCGGSCPRDCEEAGGDMRTQHPLSCYIRKRWYMNALHILREIGPEKAQKLWGRPKQQQACAACK